MIPVKDRLKVKKKLLLFFSFALILIAFLSIFAKISIEKLIQEQSEFSKVINVSGKQRMLSQRIMLLIQSLNSQKFNDGYHIMKADLINCLQLMKKANENLTHGNKIDGITKITNNEIERSYFGKINLYQRINDFAQSAEDSANKNDFNNFLKEYNIYKVNSLLIDLDKIVTLYSNESDLQIKKLIGISYIILFATITLLILEFLIIFKPISNKIYQQFMQLEDSIYNLKNEKHILEIETKSAQKALGDLVPRIEFMNKFNTEKIKLASYYQSAKEKGGDWWGIYEFNKIKIVLIGNVSGHDAGSSIIAAAVAGYFEEFANEKSLEKHDFSNIFKYLDEFIQKIDNTNQMYMSMSVLVFNENINRVKFINAAYSFPYLINYEETGETKITRFKSRGQLLGHKTSSEHDEEIKVIEYEFKENSLICLFSNGLTANTNKEKKDFSEKNLKKFFEKNNFKNTELLTVVDKLIDEAYVFYEDHPIKDDITFILIKQN